MGGDAEDRRRRRQHEGGDALLHLLHGSAWVCICCMGLHLLHGSASAAWVEMREHRVPEMVSGAQEEAAWVKQQHVLCCCT
jgi:hypothetical protein